ncbi:hypothetical protein SO802_027444 [Lithocarpus litseifolius]|uniref:Transmembrane protein n=1 Tax=Lithocarpus litseifolius TaxID=425828 RepID=A0AAW2C5Q1_9ROSI
MDFRIGSNGLMVLVAKLVWVCCVGGCEIEVDRHGFGALVVARSKCISVDGVGRGLVWCIGGCEIGEDRHGWCWLWVMGFGRGYGWCWVCLLMGSVCLPWVMGLLAVGWSWVCFFFFFLLLVMVGLMSVGVVGFVIDGGGFSGG